MRDKWPAIAKLSLAGVRAPEVAAQLGITADQVNRARKAMRKHGLLPVLRRGYRPLDIPVINGADYATHIAETLAKLHETKLCDVSEDAADKLIQDIVDEIEKQAWRMIRHAQEEIAA